MLLDNTPNNLELLYMSVWQRMLNDILGWSEQEVIAWASRYKEVLQNPNDIFYHEEPQYWAAMVFIPNELNEKMLPFQRSQMRNEIVAVFHDEYYGGSYVGVDWKRYRNSIEKIVEKYTKEIGPRED